MRTYKLYQRYIKSDYKDSGVEKIQKINHNKYNIQCVFTFSDLE